MRYILFIKQECPYCVRAIDLLEKQGKDYDVVSKKILDSKLGRNKKGGKVKKKK